AKIWRHGGRVGVSYSDHYAEQGIFQRLMQRLRAIGVSAKGWVGSASTIARFGKTRRTRAVSFRKR
ncbi:MAG: hypothetical protein ABSG32_11450, partial [Terriglobia bacterium]